jgi:hypothetical protein
VSIREPHELDAIQGPAKYIFLARILSTVQANYAGRAGRVLVTKKKPGYSSILNFYN